MSSDQVTISSVEQVHHAAEVGLAADRQLHRDGLGAQPVADRLSTERSKSAPTRSILLMKQMRGTA